MPRKPGIAASLKARIDHLLQSSTQPFRNGALAESLDHPRHITAVLPDRSLRARPAGSTDGAVVRLHDPAPEVTVVTDSQSLARLVEHHVQDEGQQEPQRVR